MLYFEDYVIGKRLHAGSYTITKEEIVEFASKWDPQPYHIDEAAAEVSMFGGIIAPGCQMVAIAIKIISNSDIRGKIIAAAGWENIRFKSPVRPNDVLSLTVECREANPSKSKPDRGIVKNLLTLTNQHEETVLEFTDILFVAKRP